MEKPCSAASLSSGRTRATTSPALALSPGRSASAVTRPATGDASRTTFSAAVSPVVSSVEAISPRRTWMARTRTGGTASAGALSCGDAQADAAASRRIETNVRTARRRRAPLLASDFPLPDEGCRFSRETRPFDYARDGFEELA